MSFKDFWTQNYHLFKTAFILFAVGIIAGITAAFYYPQIMEQILAAFSARFGDAPDLNWHLVQQIFLQNLTASAVAWVGGVLFGILPIITLFFNGFILGYVTFYILLESTGKLTTVGFLVAGLMPHGVIEIPVFILAAVLGLKLGWDWIAPTANGQRLHVLRQAFLTTFKYFIVVVVGLALAAVVEVFVSGRIVNNF